VPTLPDYQLKFEKFPGVEVVMSRLTIEELFEFNEILAMPRTNQKEVRAYLDALTPFVGKHVVDWNLEDRRGKPVPAGRITDTELLGEIRDGWLLGINGGRAPLAQQPPRAPQEDDLAGLMQEPGESPTELNGSEVVPAS
jgi:hypothetical protein